MSPFPIGIDLGTTNCAVARLDDAGRTQMVTNAEGDTLTPSVVHFGAAGVRVGKEAVEAIASDPERIVRWVKREMGSSLCSRAIDGKHFPPEAVQACILGQIRSDIERQLGKNYAVVVTVPAFFDEPRRRKTADAAAMAGLPLLDIVNEPTAAAVAFGEQLGYLDSQQLAREKQNLLVYDLGGGTFDVTVVEIKPGHIRTLATDGDSILGGYDWDQRLADYAAEQFLRTHGADPRDDQRGLQSLMLAAERAKQALSARLTVAIRVTHDDHTLEVPISRIEFEERTSDLLYRTASTTRQTLAASGLRWSEIDRVLLVGGSTRMPMVRGMLCELTGGEPHGEVNPDEAVARGAALYARHLLAQGKLSKAASPQASAPLLEITNVNSHSLGIAGFNVQLGRRCNKILIPRNSPLPARASRTFVTRKYGQKSIVVQVLEGESSQPENCAPIARLVVRDLPHGLPAGSRVKITYEYGANGRLNVSAYIFGTNCAMQLELQRSGARSAGQIASWQQVLAGNASSEQLTQLLQKEAAALSPTQLLDSGETDYTLPEDEEAAPAGKA
jgi:molecular chaperone DnaK